MGKLEVTQALVLKHFTYNGKNLEWLVPTCPKVKVGQKFGHIASNGYIRGTFYYQSFLEHRLIWLYNYGVWPTGVIDHKNGITTENTLENLRDSTNRQNQFNMKSHKGSTSKYKGVSWNKALSKWLVQYRVKTERVHVGYFESEEAAAQAYRDATETIHMEYGRYEQV